MGNSFTFCSSKVMREPWASIVTLRRWRLRANWGLRICIVLRLMSSLRGSLHEFDFIAAIDALEHIPKSEVPEFLDLVRAALRPGERFLCQVPNLAASYIPLLYTDFSHETPFTPSSLKQILELTDFTNVQVFPIGPVVHGAKSAVRYVIWEAVSVVLRFVQTVEGGLRVPLDSIFTAAIFATAAKG